MLSEVRFSATSARSTTRRCRPRHRDMSPACAAQPLEVPLRPDRCCMVAFASQRSTRLEGVRPYDVIHVIHYPVEEASIRRLFPRVSTFESKSRQGCVSRPRFFSVEWAMPLLSSCLSGRFGRPYVNELSAVWRWGLSWASSAIPKTCPGATSVRRCARLRDCHASEEVCQLGAEAATHLKRPNDQPARPCGHGSAPCCRRGSARADTHKVSHRTQGTHVPTYS